jgi:hypothetical protein
MSLGDLVQGYRCALTREQVDVYNLPHNPDALKPRDRRAGKYLAQFGNLAVELDALPPATLQEIIRKSIEEKLDLTKFEEQKRLEEVDCDELDALRNKVDDLLDTIGQEDDRE